MTDGYLNMKWFCRGLLLLLIACVGWVVIQPEYNFAHWVPHAQLRDLGVPYSVMLWFEQNAHLLLHPVVAFLLVTLFFAAQLPWLIARQTRPGLVVVLILVLAEIVQWQIGRGFEAIDLFTGLLGVLAAYWIKWTNKRELE